MSYKVWTNYETYLMRSHLNHLTHLYTDKLNTCNSKKEINTYLNKMNLTNIEDFPEKDRYYLHCKNLHSIMDFIENDFRKDNQDIIENCPYIIYELIECGISKIDWRELAGIIYSEIQNTVWKELDNFVPSNKKMSENFKSESFNDWSNYITEQVWQFICPVWQSDLDQIHHYQSKKEIDTYLKNMDFVNISNFNKYNETNLNNIVHITKEDFNDINKDEIKKIEERSTILCDLVNSSIDRVNWEEIAGVIYKNLQNEVQNSLNKLNKNQNLSLKM